MNIFIKSNEELDKLFCPNCGKREGYKYLGIEDNEVYICNYCNKLLEYSNPLHT